MARPERIQVAHEVIVWARASAGLPPDVAARRIGISLPTLENWESGELAPTIKQLRKAAKAYKRPLAVLLLSEPPRDFDVVQDFRREAAGPAADQSPELRSEIRRAVTQREVFLELRDLAPTALPDEMALEVDRNAPAEDAARAITASLNLALPRDTPSPNPRIHLNVWTSAIESLGVIVIHTRGVALEEARGFSIAEWPNPVIALNGGDFPRARLFTLLHELTHLALRSGGLCDLHETRQRKTQADRIEHYCNQVAAAALMPRELLAQLPGIQDASPSTRWTTDQLSELAARFGTSSESMLLRLITLDLASWSLYWELKPQLEVEYARAQEQRRERQRSAKGGPSFYVVKARDLGHGYVTSVLDAFRTRSITSTDVSDYLDVRFDQIPKLQAAIR